MDESPTVWPGSLGAHDLLAGHGYLAHWQGLEPRTF